MLFIVRIFVSILTLAGHLFIAQGGKIYECIRNLPGRNGTAREIKVLCPPGEVIQVREAIYGISQWNICYHTVGDCTETSDVAGPCCGRDKCNFTVWRILSVKCGSFITFFRLIYDCVKPPLSLCGVHLIQDIPPITSNNTSPATTQSTDMTSSIRQWFKSSTTTSVTGQQKSNDPEVVETKQETDDYDLAIILGSAAVVALLLAAIVAIIFLLRKYQWQSEKQCCLSIFMGMCTRHPPDGSEDPDGEDNHVRTNRSLNKISNNNSNTQGTTSVKYEIESSTEDLSNSSTRKAIIRSMESKRKRKRNEPSPEIKLFSDANQEIHIPNEVSHSKRKILFAQTLNDELVDSLREENISNNSSIESNSTVSDLEKTQLTEGDETTTAV